LLAMAAVVALKVADEAPAATVTDVGTVRVELVLVRVTMAPPVGAACVSVTVQVELLELLRVVGRQDRELTVGKGGLLFAAPPVTVPPVAKSTMPLPVGEAAALLLIPIAVVVKPAAIVRFTTPTAPFEMVLALIADATQENVPTPPKQFNDLPAAVIAVPEFTEMETTLAGG
jgi:hypothetical protein